MKNFEYLDSILDEVPFFLCRFLENGKLTYVNKTFANLLNLNKDDFVGKTIFELAKELGRDNLFKLTIDIKNHNFDKGELKSFQELKYNSKVVIIEWRIQRIKYIDKYEFQLIGTDVTEKRKAEASDQEKNKRLLLLHKFNSSLAEILNPQKIFDRFIELLQGHFPNINRTSILLFDEKSNSLISEDLVGIIHRDERLHSENQPIGMSISGRCFLENSIIYVNDCSVTDLIPKKFVEELKLKSTLAIPISFKNKPIGVLRLDNSTNINAFKESDFEFFSLLANQLGSYIENSKLFYEVELQRNKLKDSEQRYKTLISNLPQMVLVQVRGKIVYVNESFINTLGYSLVELMGSDVINLISEKEKDNILDKLEKREKGYYIPEYETELVKKEGTKINVLVRANKIVFNNQNGFLVVLTDITERKKMEDKLKEMIATKDKFFSILAHDLKGPFMGFLGASELLANSIDEFTIEEIQDLSKDLYKSLTNQYTLLEDLLTWSRLQMGSVKANPKQLNLFEQVVKILDLLQGNAKLKSIQLINNVEEGLILYIDEYMMNLLLRNLISNAIKFTPEGGEIRVGTKQNKESVIINITDSGIGIAEADQEKLFKLDKHHTTEGTNNEEGTGLGLILCKEIVEKSGGKIWLESKIGQGTTFFLEFKKN